MARETVQFDLTRAMGRLLTDRSLRDAFRSDAQSVADSFRLSEVERAALISLDPDQLDEQAAGLIAKRQTEVALLIPSTWQRLGSAAAALFVEFAESFWPSGFQRHAIDAVEFGRFLIGRKPNDLDRAEWNETRFALQRFPVLIAWVADVKSQKKQHRRAIQVLIRWRRKTRQWLIHW